MLDKATIRELGATSREAGMLADELFRVHDLCDLFKRRAFHIRSQFVAMCTSIDLVANSDLVQP